MLRLVTLPTLLLTLAACAGSGTVSESAPYAEPDSAAADIPPPPAKHRRAEVSLSRALIYDKYTLGDTIPWRDTVRVIRWDKVRGILSQLDSLTAVRAAWAVAQNRHNINGQAPLSGTYSRNAYGNLQDPYGVERFQGIPLWAGADTLPPERYALDGALVRVVGSDSLTARVSPAWIGGEWTTRTRYLKTLQADTLFDRVIAIDRAQQYIITLEKGRSSDWLIRSINPATTGLHHPPYQMETPLGIFVVQEKKQRMVYLVDGRTETGGFAPFASRFSNGAYVHGIPVNAPHTRVEEYSWSLGTTPRSHMCVRTATSHAEYVYRWAEKDRALVVVFE